MKAGARLFKRGLALRQRRGQKCRNIVDILGRWELGVGWDILCLDVRAHFKPKLVHFVLALQAPRRRRDGNGIRDKEEELWSQQEGEGVLHNFATTRELDVAAALRITGTGIAKDEPI